jgi:hypothetical protein
VPQPRRRVDVDRGLDRSLKAAWSVWAVAVSVNLVVWALVSLDQQDLTYFWPMWVAGPWGAVLVVLTVLRGGFRR